MRAEHHDHAGRLTCDSAREARIDALEDALPFAGVARRKRRLDERSESRIDERLARSGTTAKTAGAVGHDDHETVAVLDHFGAFFGARAARGERASGDVRDG